MPNVPPNDTEENGYRIPHYTFVTPKPCEMSREKVKIKQSSAKSNAASQT